MTELAKEELEQALMSVARENNAPKVLFPYGFKIIESNGEKVLCPLTPEEYRNIMKRDHGKILTDRELLNSGCGVKGGFCDPYACSGYCYGPFVSSNGEVYCDCR